MIYHPITARPGARFAALLAFRQGGSLQSSPQLPACSGRSIVVLYSTATHRRWPSTGACRRRAVLRARPNKRVYKVHESAIEAGIRGPHPQDLSMPLASSCQCPSLRGYTPLPHPSHPSTNLCRSQQEENSCGQQAARGARHTRAATADARGCCLLALCVPGCLRRRWGPCTPLAEQLAGGDVWVAVACSLHRMDQWHT